jgi:TniQ
MPLARPTLRMRTQGVFESWNCTPAVLPPRSRLYALEPIGVGTPFVESLSSYVVMLADAHAVSVGDLVGRELSRVAAKPLISFARFMKENRANSHGFHARTCAINGFGESSERWIEALERTTLRTKLRFLTLSPFDGVFSRLGVSRDTHVWCPTCYHAWRDNDAVIYEPLLWSIGIVTLCPRHLIPLIEQCPHCHCRSKPLTVFSRPGLCSRCHEWLGVCSAASAESGVSGRLADTDNALWRAEMIGELVASAPRLDGPSLHSVLIANLRACVDAVAGGNLHRFADACRVSRPPLEVHLSGRNVPSIDFLLRICWQLRIPITAFLENDSCRAATYWERARQSVDTMRMASAFRPVEQVHLALFRADEEEPVPSLMEIARRLGYKGTERLYQVDRDLCKRLSAKYRRSGQSHGWRKRGAEKISEKVDIQALLQESLAQEQPVSPHHIAARLGYANEGYLQRRFPDLCRAIRQKVAAQKVARLANVERVLTDALNEEAVPTLIDLRKRLGYSSSECLQLHFPKLCEQLLARRQAAREQDIADLKRTLQGLLSDAPAVSLRVAGERLGRSVSYLKQLCPEECARSGRGIFGGGTRPPSCARRDWSKRSARSFLASTPKADAPASNVSSLCFPRRR